MWSQLDHVEEIILLFLHQIHKYWKIIDIVKEQEKRSTNSLSCFWKFSSSNSTTKSSLIPTWQEYSNFCFFSSIFKGNFKFFDILITTNFQNLFFSKSFWRFSIDSSYLPLFFECAVQIFLIWYGYYLVTFFRVLNFETFYFLIWFRRTLWIWETTRPWKGDLRSFVESLRKYGIYVYKKRQIFSCTLGSISVRVRLFFLEMKFQKRWLDPILLKTYQVMPRKESAFLGCVYSVDCDDYNACTTDTCNKATGCVHTPVDCNDDDYRTSDRDIESGCTHTPIDCNDYNVVSWKQIKQ